MGYAISILAICLEENRVRMQREEVRSKKDEGEKGDEGVILVPLDPSPIRKPDKYKSAEYPPLVPVCHTSPPSRILGADQSVSSNSHARAHMVVTPTTITPLLP